MIRKRFLLALLPTAICAGLFVPTQALLVNRAKSLEVDLKSNGLIAHICDSGFNVGVQIDLKRISDEEKFRIVLDPRLSEPAPAGRTILPTDVVLQQMPPGSYTATKISLGGNEPMPFKSDTFAVQSGQILSMGRIRIASEKNFIGFLVGLVVSTQVDTIESHLKSIHAFGIDTLPVRVKHVKWAIEKQ